MNKKLKVLVACEESQAVTIELRKLGHNAFSCDIIECSGGHPEWHVKNDVLKILNGKRSFVEGTNYPMFRTQDGMLHDTPVKWDMIIAFPPCTDLCVSGARHFERKRADGTQQRSIDFFMKFANADCEKIAIENPVGIMSSTWRKPDQIINPWQFGDSFNKKTCIWLKGLKKLEPTNIVEKEEIIEFSSGRKMSKMFVESFRLPKDERAKLRSKTFPGIAKAMAEQWAGKVEE